MYNLIHIIYAYYTELEPYTNTEYSNTEHYPVYVAVEHTECVENMPPLAILFNSVFLCSQLHLVNVSLSNGEDIADQYITIQFLVS